jgi:hypothetical protein
MPRKAQRRFVELSVGEVSLVDSPANEQEFIVIKRLDQEDGDMADTNTAVVKTEAGQAPAEASTTDVQKGNEVEKVPVEVNKAATEAVEKAMAQVTELVENIAKAAQGTTQDTPADGEGDTDVEKANKNPRGMFMKQLKANGVEGDKLEKALAEFDKAFPMFKPGAGTQKPEKSVQKDVNGGEGEADDGDADITKTLEAIALSIHKAKQFTPKRQEALEKAIGTLQDLLKELGMQKIPTGQSPSSTVPAGTMFGASGVATLTKGIEALSETVAKALGEVQEVTKALGDRVEAIEKTRQPSTSVDGDGDTDTTTTKKSMWSGVL